MGLQLFLLPRLLHRIVLPTAKEVRIDFQRSVGPSHRLAFCPERKLVDQLTKNQLSNKPLTDQVSIRWVTWWPVSYWTDRFDHLARRDDTEFEAVFLAGRSSLLAVEVNPASWRFKHTFLSQKAESTGYYSKFKLQFPTPWPLVKGRFDAVVMPYSEVSCIAAAVLCWVLRKPHFLFTGNTRYDVRKSSRIRYWLKRILLKSATGILVSGPLQREYVLQYVKDKGKVEIIGNPTGSLEPELYSAPGIREELRAEFGWRDDEVVLLYVGRLASEKGLLTLIDALGKASNRGVHPTLVLVGSGPLEAELRARAQDMGVKVQLTGFLQRNELARRYAASDVFVLPSQSEPWGLVVNEAMEFGLPLVLSSHVGSVPVLLKEGENGFLFPVGDSDALASYVEHLYFDKELRQQMGRLSRRIIQDHSLENWGEAVLTAVRKNQRRQLEEGPHEDQL